MKLLFLAAVDFELDAARRACALSDAESDAVFVTGGVGAAATQEALERAFRSGVPFDRVVNVGVAGSSTPRLPIGSVAHVVSERHGDRDEPLLCNPAPWPELGFLPQAKGRTLQDLDDRWRREPADIESMEGAAFFECCLRQGVPFAEIRAVSNQVGERDHARWDIPLALKNLQTALETFLNVLK